MALVRFVLFCIFFTIGASAVTLAIITDEVSDYYENKKLLKKVRANSEKIASLTTEYDAQIQYIQTDPKVLSRLRKVTLGQETDSWDTVYPKASEEQLAAASVAVLEDLQPSDQFADIPHWLQRCSEPRFRQSLFFAGAGLILITFIFFGTVKSSAETEDRSIQTQ